MQMRQNARQQTRFIVHDAISTVLFTMIVEKWTTDEICPLCSKWDANPRRENVGSLTVEVSDLWLGKSLTDSF